MTMIILVDWIAFTYKKEEHPQTALEKINMSFQNFTLLKKGGLGYKKQAIYKNIKVFWDGMEGMGTHIQISGKGCRFLEEKINLFKLIKKLNEDEDINFTRLDIAMDTPESVLKKVISSIEKGLYISKSRNIQMIQKTNGKSIETETIYLGSRNSNVYWRFYNKAKEQKISCFTWERFEVELKKKYISRFMNEVEKKGINKAYKSLLNSYFRPIVKEEKNISRSETEPYWIEFLNEIEKISLYEKPEKKTLQDKRSWIENQVAPTLSLLYLADEDLNFYINMVKNNVKRIKKGDLELLYEEEKNECSNFER